DARPAESADGSPGPVGRRSFRAPVTRRRRTPVALPAGAHPGQEDGQGDDLLPGALGLHARQLDADPPGPERVRQVRQARRRLQRRVARLADPQDPAHRRSAQHRAVRRGPPRPGDRRVGHLRRPRLPGGGDLRRGPRQGRAGRRRAAGATPRRPARRGRGGGRRRRGAGGADRRRAGPGRRPRRRGRQDHLQLLRGAARRAARGRRAHLQPGRRPALRPLLPPDV
ncbi:MAG: Redox-sensing transcriptional repressor Rex, partial [uncultured Solirubrobacteraceae bacterium]